MSVFLTITLERNDLLPRHSARWFILTQSRSSSQVKVTGQSSRSHEESVAEVVDATSSEGFLVVCHLTVDKNTS